MPARHLFLPVRRDCPEIVLPDDGATLTGCTPGLVAVGTTADTFTAWAEICSTTEFGANERVLVGCFDKDSSSIALTTNGSARLLRTGIVELGTGAAASEVTKQQLIFQNSASAALSAQVLDVAPPSSATGTGFNCQFRPCGPLLIPASTRVSFRAQHHDTGVSAAHCVYAACYDPALLAYSKYVTHWDQYLRGVAEFHSDYSDYLTLTLPAKAGSVISSCAYSTMNVNGGATLDADYLVTGCIITPVADAQYAVGRIFDIALGTAGNEVIQSRAAVPSSGTTAAAGEYGLDQCQWPAPFIGYAGETLRVRGRTTSAFDETWDIRCTLVRINKA